MTKPANLPASDRLARDFPTVQNCLEKRKNLYLNKLVSKWKRTIRKRHTNFLVSLFWDLKLRFGILELQNWVTKSSYAKWRHTSSYQLEYFYKNSSFELLTLLRKTSNFTSSYYNSMGKLSFYHFRVSKSMLKNKTFHFELLSRSWKRKSFTSSY